MCFVRTTPNKVQFAKTKMRCIMLGLDAAGKTSIIYKLQPKGPISTFPMECFHVEKFEYKRIVIDVWDVGGQDCNRAHLCNFFVNTQGLIFVVDSDDIFRIEDAREELHKLFKEEDLRDAVLLIYANKQDLPRAIKLKELEKRLGLNEISNHEWKIQGSCARTGEGIIEGLNWLEEQINKKLG